MQSESGGLFGKPLPRFRSKLFFFVPQNRRGRGAEDVRRQVRAANFHPDKDRAARRWLWWHDHWLTVIGITAAVIAALAGAANLFI